MRFVLIGIVALLVVAASMRRADAAGCGNCPVSPTQYDSKGPGRAVYIEWATIIDTTFTAVDGVWYWRTGKRNAAVNGLQLLLSLPAVAYGATYVEADQKDWQAWGLTLWSGALLAHALWPAIRSRFEPDAPTKPARARTAFDFGPQLLIGWDDGHSAPGLMASGAF